MRIFVIEKVEKDISVASLHIKVRDEFFCTLQDNKGTGVSEYSGYVPTFFPGQHYGEYLMLDIDLETGQILNWKKPSKEDIESLINK